MLNKQINACRKCTLCDLVPDGALPLAGSGHKNDIFIVTEHPLVDNMVLQDHKTTLAEKLLIDKFLPECGIHRYYITTVMKCYSETYKKNELNTCFGWIQEELKYYTPKAIILFGALCVKSFFPQFKTPRLKDLAYTTVMAEPYEGAKFPTFIEYSPNHLLQTGQRVYKQAVDKTKKFMDLIYEDK
jgi:uracil-DNA glycosylase family 4